MANEGKTETVTLKRSWRRRARLDGPYITYGPGKGVGIPVALADDLRAAGHLPRSEELPADMPARDALMAAGLTTLKAVAEHEDLQSIDGIGEATEAKIKEYLSA